MSNSLNNSNDRNTMMIRFVIVYVVCLLCAIIPLYYLFSLKDLVPEKLDLPKKESKDDIRSITRFQQITSQLDSILNKQNMAPESIAILTSLFTFTKDSLDRSVPYKPLFLKTYDLYKFKSAIMDTLRKRTESMTVELNKCKNECRDLKEQNLNLIKLLGASPK
jgi:hypothetical protein